MNLKAWIPLACSVALGMSEGGAALAQSAERVAAHTDWSVFVAGNPRECYIVSPPTASVARRDGSNVEVNRGDVRLFVAFRPGDGVSNEVSFTGGYPFQTGTPIRLDVGASSFAMSPGTGDAVEWAWTSQADDAQAVSALRRGASATVTGTSSRGTETVDTFSLSGFTAAVTDAEARCQ